MFTEKLKNYFKAGIPAVQIVTYEEQRILNDIIEIYGKDSVICWSMTCGFHAVGNIQLDGEPANIVDGLKDFALRKEKIGVFFDFDEFQEGQLGSELKRKLRDVIKVFEQVGKKLIFICKRIVDIYEIPQLMYDLPSENEIPEILDGMVDSFKEANENAPDDKKMNMDYSSGAYDALIRAGCGLTEYELRNAYALAFIENKGFNQAAIKTVQRLKAEQVAKDGILEYYEPNIDFKDVGGNKGLIEYIKRRVKLFSTKAVKAGIPTPKGIIITGITGTGKSMFAKLVGGIFNLPLVRINIGALFGGLVGSSEANLRRTLKQIEALSPCVLWIDEMEKSFSGIKSGNTGSDVPQRLFGEFLTWFTECTKQIYKVATCNDILKLPPEITNRTRFDEVFFIDLPSDSERQAVFKIHMKKKNIKSKGISITRLAKETDGYTPSEIEQICKEAVTNAFYYDKIVDETFMVDAIHAVKPISQIMKEDIDALRAYAKDRFRFANGIDKVSVTSNKRKINFMDN